MFIVCRVLKGNLVIMEVIQLIFFHVKGNLIRQ